MKLNNFEKRVFAFGLALSLVVTGSGVNAGIAVAAKKPKLSKSKLKITAGKTAVLTVKNANKKVKWSTNKKKIVKINATNGKKKEKAVIRGVKSGKAVITAKVGKVKLKCRITVKKQRPNFKSVSVDNFDKSCLVLKLKKKDTSLKVTDLSVTTKQQTAGAYNKKISVQKVVPVNAKQYRVYLQEYIRNGSYVQITSGVSKAATQFKAPFYGKDEDVNIILKKGDTVDLGMDEYFYNDIGSLKVSCTKGKLPEGLTIDKKRSKIKGIPTATGTTAVTLQGVDEMGRKATIKVNFCIYDETTIASGNQSDEIAWTHSKAEAAAAQVAANATRLDVDKRDDIADYYVKCYSIAPQGGSGNYTFTLDTPDNADVRLSTDKIADDASKTVTKKSGASTKLCIPYSITAGTHTYTVTAADVMDANRTCQTTITVKVTPYYNLSGVVKSSNGMPITGAEMEFIPSTAKSSDDIFYTYSSSNYNNASNGAEQEIGYYDIEVPAGTYTVKVAGDVSYEMTRKIKSGKADKMETVSVPEKFYGVSGSASYANSSNKLVNKKVYFESLNNQYETSDGDFSTTTNSRGTFTIALPANTYIAYINDEKGNRKYFGNKITVTNKDINVGSMKASISRYSVEGIVFNGTSVDQQTQFADKIRNTTLNFYNDKGACVAKAQVGEDGYYKVFLPGDAVYTVKTLFGNATRLLGSVTVAKENQKDINLTYTVANDIAGAAEYVAAPLAAESVVTSTGGNNVIWKFTPAETGEYDFKVSTAVNKGAEVAIFDANMQYITGTKNNDDSEDHANLNAYIQKVTLEAGKTYYIKAQPTGVKTDNTYTPQAQGEVKLVITHEAPIVVPTPAPVPTQTPTPVPPASGSAINPSYNWD